MKSHMREIPGPKKMIVSQYHLHKLQVISTSLNCGKQSEKDVLSLTSVIHPVPFQKLLQKGFSVCMDMFQKGERG